ncbi:dipeptidyl carboxypeptidase II [Pseudoalteromonas rubra]|uniref:Dipeptidyl carboxypeptidase II n=1 Tax=Pseudoalteromonas rubra TaxID=43658 RepID=A0A5S3WGV3_9GAMM|nr:M3 family metallopeptidase [Pseudoalteromonas rubra]TMP26150.1 dipeptidyl carboxypeptidase II [Pseudoalteromonas rubra]TMP32953.1 dipeptidyl carboxypeptidase II [Pseudoalteromonas rubra]
MKKLLALAVSSALLVTACTGGDRTSGLQKGAASATVTEGNPLLVSSTLQYQSPDFNTINDAHFAPAFEQGMAEQMTEVNAIISQTDPASFSNTIVALERSGELLKRTQAIFFNLSGTDSNAERRALQSELAPKLAGHYDNIYLNKALYERVAQVYGQLNALNLSAEEKRLTEVFYKRFVRAGAKLNEAQQKEIREINASLSSLTTQFSQHLLALSKSNVVLVEDKAKLAGLSDAHIAQLAEAAEQAGHPGQYLIKITNTTRQPILSKLDDRQLREQVWRASAYRGLKGDNNNREIVAQLAQLRAKKAALLGYESWAHYGLDEQMAKTPSAVYDMFASMVPALLKNVESEAQAIKNKIRATGGDFELQAWDWLYYADKVRQDKFDLDESQVKAYFEFNRVLEDGLFFTMERLYGVTFKPRNDIPVYHPDVKAYEVFDADGTSLAIFMADYFARDGKRGGAWMSSFVQQSGLDNQRPVVINVMNIEKAPEGQPTLLSYSETTTMFHELGHGLHGMLSQVTYPSLAGTSVSRDFVEFPSTFEEDWAIHPEVIQNYAKHYQTGEAIPQALLNKVIASRSFNMGFDTLEYVAAALLDMEWHALAADAPLQDLVEFEQAALTKHGVNIDYVPPRYKSAYFAHSMGGGYSAGYYAYMWSEILAADAFAYVQSQGGLNRKIGTHYRKNILEVGNSRDLMESYKAFRGTEPTTEALLKRRGLNVAP